MKKILMINDQSNTTSVALLIARIGIAVLMLTHGIPKMLMLFSGQPVQFPPVLGMSAEISLALAVFSEVLCSVLILAGLVTRIAVVPLIITMIVAAFMIHAGDPMKVKEPAIQYLLVYLVLFFAGSGKFSVDYLLNRKTQMSYNKNVIDSTLLYPGRNNK